MWTGLGLIVRLAGFVVGEPSVITLEWPAVPGCPSAAEVEAATRRLLGDAPQPVWAAATVERGAEVWTLRLVVRDAAGSRSRALSSPDCGALADAAAVILAVAAAPIEAGAAPAGPGIGATGAMRGRGAPVDELEGVVITPEQATAPRRAAQAGLFVQAGAGVGPAPGVVAGVAVGVALVGSRLRLDARASYWGRGALRLADAPTVGADLRLVTGGLRACPLLVRARFALQLCAGAEFGGTIVHAVGLAEDYAPRSLWAAGSLAPGLRWRPRRWLALGLELEGVVPFTRREYRVDGTSQRLHRTPPLGVRVLAGLEFNFP